MEKIILYTSVFVISFAATAVAVKLLLPLLVKLKMGQRILEIGPSWHMGKQGTPTMGGISFAAALVISSMIYLLYSGTGDPVYFLGTLGYILSGALIGFADDSLKMSKKENEGLTASVKLFFQLVTASAYISFCVAMGYVTTDIYIPFTGISVDAGGFYYLFAVLTLTGISNAVNFTDGIDGLCSSVTATAALFMALLSVRCGDYENIFFSLAISGICLGFLIFNFYPAKIFMGDTGSLFLGAAIGAIAVTSMKNTAIFIIGAVYIAEAASVVLQVIWFKITGKRLFLMAPLHHHFEKKGLSEVKIVLIFTTATFLTGIIGSLLV